jgi:hypothetical protein
MFSKRKAMLACFSLIFGCVGVAWWLRVFRCIIYVRPLWNKSNKAACISMRRLELRLLTEKT